MGSSNKPLLPLQDWATSVRGVLGRGNSHPPNRKRLSAKVKWGTWASPPPPPEVMIQCPLPLPEGHQEKQKVKISSRVS